MGNILALASFLQTATRLNDKHYCTKHYHAEFINTCQTLTVD